MTGTSRAIHPMFQSMCQSQKWFNPVQCAISTWASLQSCPALQPCSLVTLQAYSVPCPNWIQLVKQRLLYLMMNCVTLGTTSALTHISSYLFLQGVFRILSFLSVILLLMGLRYSTHERCKSRRKECSKQWENRWQYAGCWEVSAVDNKTMHNAVVFSFGTSPFFIGFIQNLFNLIIFTSCTTQNTVVLSDSTGAFRYQSQNKWM